ncbi:aminotransferase class V-fold PLP-dependent enzyme [Vibrio parahaemolyticus]|uniref:aminotransferase class V-fold PLP-dependent enzyme n=1 Tax=Vibrio parahaemolyticus TaxID=670 RepID=UPI002269FA2E|nr:aminotransferase class V-fold PLP-dependent enzyme [Vibrio parahaemolyticus]MCX8797339.1 aminotransferase class V-fold PLP-dependent enzyme [Vibrio parahaemolyticus]
MSDKDSIQTNRSRRNFLKGATGAVVAGVGASAFSGVAQAREQKIDWSSRGLGRKHDKRFWRKVQKQFVLDKRTTYMNIGTTGSMPKHVLEGYEDNNKLVAKFPWDMKGKFGKFPYVSDMIAEIAPGFGANADEIILSRNTTDGLCSIINGLHFEPGDVILTTHHEHIAATSPLNVVKHRFGVEVVEIQLPVFTGTEDVSEADYIQAFRDAIESHHNVRLIVFSHITYKTGTALPAKAICSLAKEHQIPTLVDGAHTVGMFDLDLHDLDCDFYSGSGHKWQCGPGATGILYVRDNGNRLNEYWSDRENPLWLINSSLSHADYLGKQIQMQYIGNDNYPAKQALADSCKMWDEIGRDRIQDRILKLSDQCKTSLQDVLPHAKMFSPNVEGLTSGLTTFNPFYDVTNEEILTEFRDRLREEYGYIIRTTNFKLYKDDGHDAYALRISTHLFHDERDVEGLVEAIADLYYSF